MPRRKPLFQYDVFSTTSGAYHVEMRLFRKENGHLDTVMWKVKSNKRFQVDFGETRSLAKAEAAAVASIERLNAAYKRTARRRD